MGPGLSTIYKVRRLTDSRICIISKTSGSLFQTVLCYQVAIRPLKVQSKAGRSHLNPAGGYDFSRARGAHRHRAAWKPGCDWNTLLNLYCKLPKQDQNLHIQNQNKMELSG